MKSTIKQIMALSLLVFAGLAFGQDDAAEVEAAEVEAAEVEAEEGGWFDSITGWFSGIGDWFGGSDEDSVEAETQSASSSGGMHWYGGAGAGVAKYEDSGLSTSVAYNAYGGAILGNRLGFEAGYTNLGESDIKSAPGATLDVDGFRGLITASTAADAGDNPVRVGLGYYSLDAAVGSASESSSGVAAAVNFEKKMTERLFLNLGVDFYFGAKAFGERSDVVVFGLGVAFHTGQAAAGRTEEDEGDDAGAVEVTEPVSETEEPVAEEPVPEETPAE